MPQEIRGMVFRIELIGVEKPIWRRFFVPGNISFKKFQADGEAGHRLARPNRQHRQMGLGKDNHPLLAYSAYSAYTAYF